ncbi:hypothetical protein [Streptomyces sp. NPDC088755]
MPTPVSGVLTAVGTLLLLTAVAGPALTEARGASVTRRRQAGAVAV